MSDRNQLDELAGQAQQELLAATTDDERQAILDRFKADVERIVWDIFREAGKTAPFLEYISKLIQRQGTITPDFDALYRRKAELDHDPRP